MTKWFFIHDLLEQFPHTHKKTHMCQKKSISQMILCVLCTSNKFRKWFLWKMTSSEYIYFDVWFEPSLINVWLSHAQSQPVAEWNKSNDTPQYDLILWASP